MIVRDKENIMKSRILYIEDNEQNLYLVTFILEKAGYEIFQAHDGKTGIEMAAQLKPDLILLDILLPKMDGYAVAKAIRKDNLLDNTPIVALTSYAMPGDMEKAIEAGCVGYIEKPINPDTFSGEVSRYLKPVNPDK
jgi:two-component system, cell cycle response regulator DivK